MIRKTLRRMNQRRLSQRKKSQRRKNQLMRMSVSLVVSSMNSKINFDTSEKNSHIAKFIPFGIYV